MLDCDGGISVCRWTRRIDLDNSHTSITIIILDSHLTGLPSLSKTNLSPSSVGSQTCTLQPPSCLNAP